MGEKLNFSNTLTMWYLMNKRDLPWRKSKDPYSIWLSEIILQQTRISQGTAYYEKFVDHFKDVFALAKADEAQVLKLWQGLGYYSRARNLHQTSKIIANQYQGNFPAQFEQLLALKGVGDYTASAIASISFDLPHATVDGNVYRVLSRYFAISTPINSSKGIKEFKTLAQHLLDDKNPGDHNQAIMEFGALICTPRNPECTNCVLNDSCLALKQKKINDLPVKTNKIKVKKRYLNYFVINSQKMFTSIKQRKAKDIWQHLFEFPLLETASIDENLVEMETFLNENNIFPNSSKLKKFNLKPIIHKLSHQTLYTTFWIIETNESIENGVKWVDLKNFAFPVLLQNFVDKYQN